MSCYEWESGTIKLPAGEWAAFRKGVLESWNQYQSKLLEEATQLQNRLKEALKGHRGAARDEALRQTLDRLCPEAYDVRELAVAYEGSRYVLKKAPKRKDLKLVPVSKDATLDLGDSTITLRNETRTVTWVVPENNHAREYAQKHPVARDLFRRLTYVRWTKGSGGEIVGNDEYNRENNSAGGGANYVIRTFGPQTKSSRKTRPLAWK